MSANSNFKIIGWQKSKTPTKATTKHSKDESDYEDEFKEAAEESEESEEDAMNDDDHVESGSQSEEECEWEDEAPVPKKKRVIETVVTAMTVNKVTVSSGDDEEEEDEDAFNKTYPHYVFEDFPEIDEIAVDDEEYVDDEVRIKQGRSCQVS